jgi:hypothetical protein
MIFRRFQDKILASLSSPDVSMLFPSFSKKILE